MNFEDKIEKDPSSVGFCTFAEFRKNPDKWRFRKDQLLESVDNGLRDDNLKKKIGSTKYFMEGYPCDSVERVESMAAEMGVKLQDIVSAGIVREKTTNGQWNLKVHFMSKENFEKRKTW